MERPIYRRTTCRFCGSRELELVLQLKASPIGDAYLPQDQSSQHQELYPIDLFLCCDCGLAQLLDVIKPEILYRNYIYKTRSSMGLQEHFERYVDDVLARVELSGDSLAVDIGSNDGTLLRVFKGKNMRVVGIDPAPEIAACATASGIETKADFFNPELAEKICKEYGRATIITANNVLANIDDVPAILKGVKLLLAPDGIFVFESYYLLDLLKNSVFDFIYHEHISSFSVKPIEKLLRAYGMELINIKHIDTKGGSLRFTAQLTEGMRSVEDSVGRAIAEEERAGLFNPETFANFDARISKLKQQTKQLLEQLKRQGKSIVGYGASITVTTLIYHFEIGEYIDYLVDDNLERQGLFSPGMHIPVHAPTYLNEKKPDYIIVLAWRYAEAIISQHREFEGHFIVPVPELKVL